MAGNLKVWILIRNPTPSIDV